MQNKDIAKYIDHTLLKADATEAAIIKLCQEAQENQFATVCVNPHFVALAARELNGSGVGVCTVAGFPLGANRTQIKAQEAQLAIQDGATEIDMVINISALKDKRDDYVRSDIQEVAKVCHQAGKKLKVIIETCLLTEEEKIRACQLSKEAGADFVKTSTGFSTGGATVEDITLMRKTVGPEIGVKASGGVRDVKTALAMIEAGATRIGTSSGASY